MIPKAEVLALAEESGLLPTTIEKDYVLGWVLFAIAEHPELAGWRFKGGTCLKKCHFDTYRFSEDLDFTLPADTSSDRDAIEVSLQTVAVWVRDRAGIDFPAEGIEVRESINRHGHRTFEARMTFVGPLQLPSAARQRIRFDLTSDEVVVAPPMLLPVFHGYSDGPESSPTIACYSLAEVLAEKTRALLERSGRARDVYDVVNVGRNFRDRLSPNEVVVIAERKFRFKGLVAPTPEVIMAGIDADVLATDWDNALRHQLPVLPPVGEFLTALRGVLDWLFTPARPGLDLPAVSSARDEVTIPRVTFRPARPVRATRLRTSAAPWPAEALTGPMDRIRYAARNRLLVEIMYHGVRRRVEPYSLRRPRTGNLLLYVWEVERGGRPGGGVKAFKVAQIAGVRITDFPFAARYMVEL